MYQDPRKYLNTDVRIIAENETHAVIALPIKKAWLRRNLTLLAALVELALDAPLKVS